MKAVMPVMPPDILAYRQRHGMDRYDEMWQGVLHMAPAPNFAHQDLEGETASWLRRHWGRPRHAKVIQQINVASVGGWPDDFRIPDICLLTPERFHINRNEYLEGAPNLLIEIHCPGDETYEKLTWYAALGVPEVWVIHRDTKEPEIHLLRRGRYRKQRVLASGWLRSLGTGIELRRTPDDKLGIRLINDDVSRDDLPVD